MNDINNSEPHKKLFDKKKDVIGLSLFIALVVGSVFSFKAQDKIAWLENSIVALNETVQGQRGGGGASAAADNTYLTFKKDIEAFVKWKYPCDWQLILNNLAKYGGTREEIVAEFEGYLSDSPVISEMAQSDVGTVGLYYDPNIDNGTGYAFPNAVEKIYLVDVLVGTKWRTIEVDKDGYEIIIRDGKRVTGEHYSKVYPNSVQKPRLGKQNETFYRKVQKTTVQKVLVNAPWTKASIFPFTPTRCPNEKPSIRNINTIAATNIVGAKTLLNLSGFEVKSATNLLDPATVSVLKGYQTYYGLTVDGKLNSKTLTFMNGVLKTLKGLEGPIVPVL